MSTQPASSGEITVRAQNYTKAQLKLRYDDITALYELAEELVSTVEHPEVNDAEEQLALVESLVEQVGEAADVLSEEFINIAENNSRVSASSRGRVEGSLRKLYLAFEHYRKQAVLAGAKIGKRAQEITDDVVTRIKRQTERAIAIFIEFIDLSIDRIMNKAQFEQLKLHQAQVALQLHRMSQMH